MRPGRLGALWFRVSEVRRATGLARLPATLARGLLVRDYLLTELVLEGWAGRGDPDRIPPGVESRLLTEVDLPVALAANPTLSASEVHRRWREGQVWTGWWMGGTLAHWRWHTTSTAYLPYLGRRVRALPGDIWILEVFTDPDHRNRGLHGLSTGHALASARTAGCRRVLGLVSAWNRPGMHVMVNKWRRAPVARVGYVGVGPWRRHYMRGRVSTDDTGALFVPPAQAGGPRSGSTLSVHAMLGSQP